MGSAADDGTLSGVNLVDVVLGTMLLVAAVRGWRRGALSQVFAFGGAAIGLVLGAVFAPDIATEFIDTPGVRLSLITFGILVVALLVGQLLGYLVGARLRVAAERSGAGAADSVFGVLVGLVSLVLSLWLAGSILAQGPTAGLARQVRGSTVLGLIDETLGPPPDVFGRVAGYLDQQGFPQVFAGLQGATAPPVAPPSGEFVELAAAAGTPSTVQVESLGCDGVSAGSGFVTQPGFVVTNAHVIAGGEVIRVRDPGGTHDAVPIHVDPELDLAVLSVPNTTATPLPWASAPVDRGVAGATLGFPGGQRELNIRPAAVRGRQEALGRDIYGRSVTSREILTLEAAVAPGDSGGPFVTAAGEVGGVVFAASTAGEGVGYALTAERVQPDIAQAIARNTPMPTGACRF